MFRGARYANQCCVRVQYSNKARSCAQYVRWEPYCAVRTVLWSMNHMLTHNSFVTSETILYGSISNCYVLPNDLISRNWRCIPIGMLNTFFKYKLCYTSHRILNIWELRYFIVLVVMPWMIKGLPNKLYIYWWKEAWSMKHERCDFLWVTSLHYKRVLLFLKSNSVSRSFKTAMTAVSIQFLNKSTSCTKYRWAIYAPNHVRD